MLVKEFRGVDFVNRDKEIKYFLDYFKNEPERVLWVYGPKSTGKTTLIEYIIENKLDLKNYNIKYINFRGLLVSNFDNFIESLLEEDDKEIQTELNRNYNVLGLFRLEAKTLKKIKEKKKNLFDVLIKEFQKEKKKNIFIIDEIQTLQDIYMNGGKLLLNEFLNFCIRLTKELHVSHVLILTSNTIFLNQIYNNAKMKETGLFKLIDHLEYNHIKEWLLNLGDRDKGIGFRIEDIDLIYEYVGGSATRIKRIIDERKYYNSLKEQLEEMAEIAKNEIIFAFRDLRKKDKEYLIEPFKELIKDILDNGYSTQESKEIEEVIDYFCDIEILFFDPINNKVRANSKIYEKAFEKLVISN